MRQIESELITKTVEELFIKANYNIPQDIQNALNNAYKEERTNICKSALDSIIKNIDAAKELDLPICQDTGMAVVFIEIGGEVNITGDSLINAVNKGVHNAYLNGFLRCSVVSDPLRRKNTGDNTPAVIHTEIVEGDKIKITAAPKGFGSENMRD
jgi:fumarate hydratase subunit alpha